MSEDEIKKTEGSEDFVAPETGSKIEQEKPVRELIISSEGRVDGQGLDDIEKYLFEEASSQGAPAPSPFPHIAIYGIAQRLGFEVTEKDTLSEPLRDNSKFGRIDSKVGDVSYKETPVAEDAKPLKLKKREIPVNDDNRRHHFGPYLYRIDSKIPGIDQDIINKMLPSVWHTNTESFDLKLNAAQEIARRLGYKVELED